MKAAIYVLGLFLLISGTVASAQDHDQLLYQTGPLYMRANKNYTTGLYAVYGAPHTGQGISVSRVAIRHSGSEYCNILLDGVQYTTHNGGYLQRAVPTGEKGVYEIPEGSIRAIQIDYTQSYWDGVTCSLYAYALPGGGPSEAKLLGTIGYTGGFADKAPVPVWTDGKLAGFQLVVPQFCQGLEILSAGTVVDGVYFSATKGSNGRFRTHPDGATNVSRVLVTMNGPKHLQCDIPVYESR